MMRVRFDTGLVVQYNDAEFISHSNGYASLYRNEVDSIARVRLIAIVPHSAIIEVAPACSVTNTCFDAAYIEVRALGRSVASLTRKINALTKSTKSNGGLK